MHLRQCRRRTVRLFLALALLGLVLAGGPRTPAAGASCAGPIMAVGAGPIMAVGADAPDIPGAQPTAAVTVPTDRPLRVSGQWFHHGCEDTVSTNGCGAPLPPSDPETPMLGVDLVLTQGSSTWVLGTSDASDRQNRYAIAWLVDLPPSVDPGPATLRAGGIEVPITIDS